MNYVEYLKSIRACNEAILAAQGMTAQQSWDKCERGDWMLWLIGKLSGGPDCAKRKRLVLTTCKCARLGLIYIPDDEKRPLRAIEAAEQWARGENGITSDDVEIAANAANAAANAAYAANAANAVYDANAANAAAYAAYAAYAAETLKQCADIVRADYPISPAVEIIGENK